MVGFTNFIGKITNEDVVGSLTVIESSCHFDKIINKIVRSRIIIVSVSIHFDKITNKDVTKKTEKLFCIFLLMSFTKNN